MWYFYDLTLLPENKIQLFSEELEESFKNIFNGSSKEEFLNINLKNNLAAAEKFKTLFLEFYELYVCLGTTQKEYLKNSFENNIKIEELLNNSTTVSLFSYEDIKTFCSISIAKKLQDFFEYLYDDLPERAPFKKNYISLTNYYKTFVDNKIVKHICPFCGINSFETTGEKYREDFDHFFPKGQFPFLSLHYKNIVPMCHNCNTKYKQKKVMRDYFFPFNPVEHTELKINGQLVSGEVREVELINQNNESKLIVWDKVFDIKNRSKEIINRLLNVEIESILEREWKIEELGREKRIFNIQRYRASENIFKESIYEFLIQNPIYLSSSQIEEDYDYS